MTTTATANDPSSTTTTPTNYLKPLEFCDLLFSQPLKVFAAHWWCFLTIALCASGLRALLAFIVDVVNGPDYSANYGMDADVTAGYYNVDYNSNQPLDTPTIIMNMVDSMILFVVECLTTGASVQVVAELYATGARISPMVAIGTAGYKGVPLVGSCLLVTAGVSVMFLVLLILCMPFMASGGYMVFIILAMGLVVYVSLVTFCMYPVIMVEHNKGMMESIQRSFKLTEGHLGHILCIWLVYGLFQSLLSIVVVVATFDVEQNPNNMVALWSRKICGFIITTVFMALMAVIRAVVYFHIRVKDEGLTQETLVKEMGLSDATPYTKMENTEEAEAEGTNSNKQQSTTTSKESEGKPKAGEMV